MSRLIWIIAVIVLVIGGVWLYNAYGHKDTLGSGLVISSNSAADSDSKDSKGSADPNSASPSQVPSTPPTSPAPIATTQQQPPQPAPKPSAALPVSDTLDRNPPNGAVFAATGQYTWYRQGNITWRVNSKTGAACIAFATLEEWHKRIVYSHACHNA